MKNQNMSQIQKNKTSKVHSRAFMQKCCFLDGRNKAPLVEECDTIIKHLFDGLEFHS